MKTIMLMLLALHGACSLDEISRSECGNFVVEAGEDCDSPSADCGQPGGVGQCRFLCANDGLSADDGDSDQDGCPKEGNYVCGGDDICRKASNTFSKEGERPEPSAVVALNVSEFAAGNLNGDGYDDLVGVGAVGVVTVLGGNPQFSELLTTTGRVGTPEITGHAWFGNLSNQAADEAKLLDVVFPLRDGIGAVAGDKENVVTPVLYQMSKLGSNGHAMKIVDYQGVGRRSTALLEIVDVPNSTKAHLKISQTGELKETIFESPETASKTSAWGVESVTLPYLYQDSAQEQLLLIKEGGAFVEGVRLNGTSGQPSFDLQNSSVWQVASSQYGIVGDSLVAFLGLHTGMNIEREPVLFVQLARYDDWNSRKVGFTAGAGGQIRAGQLNLRGQSVNKVLAAGAFDSTSSFVVTPRGLFSVKNNDMLVNDFDASLTPIFENNGKAYTHATIADVNGDGLEDIVAALENSDVAVFMRNGTLFNKFHIDTQEVVSRFQIADFDGDFNSDISFLTAQGELNEVWVAYGGTTQGAPVSDPVSVAKAREVVAFRQASLDSPKDAVDDLVVLSRFSATEKIAYGLTGATSRTMMSSFRVPLPDSARVLGVTGGRFTSTSFTDTATFTDEGQVQTDNRSLARLDLWKGTDDRGGLSPLSNRDTIETKATGNKVGTCNQIITGNLNGDDADDVMLVPYQLDCGLESDTIAISLANTATNNFFDPMPISIDLFAGDSTNWLVSDAVLFDFNHDELDDLVVAIGQEIRVYINEGGALSSTGISYRSSGPPRGLWGGDFDYDGTPDIITRVNHADGSRSSVEMLIFEGNEIKRRALLFDTPVVGAGHLAVGDFNNDGLRDIALGVASLIGVGLNSALEYENALVHLQQEALSAQ